LLVVWFVDNIAHLLFRQHFFVGVAIVDSSGKRGRRGGGGGGRIPHFWGLVVLCAVHVWRKSELLRIHSLRVGWRNFFSSCAVVSVFGSGGK
jgi:hypothetical protein